MYEIINMFGEVVPFDGMTITTSLIYNTFKLWSASLSTDIIQDLQKEVLKKTVIYVTSQDRGEIPHINGGATDLSVYSNKDDTAELVPSPLLLIIAGELSKYGFKVFVSTYNYHLHIEPGNDGPYAETLYFSNIKAPPILHEDNFIIRNSGKRRVESLQPEIFNILILYKSFPSNETTDLVLAYFNRNKSVFDSIKKDYDNYYKKIFPTGDVPIWGLTPMTPQQTANYITAAKNPKLSPEAILKFAGAIFFLFIVYKKVIKPS